MVIRINRVYTRGGDRGVTSLAGGERVEKDSDRIECYGTVDELNAVLGLVRAASRRSHQTLPAGSRGGGARTERLLVRIQNELFDLGADFASPSSTSRTKKLRIGPSQVRGLERAIDLYNTGLPELMSFVLPGGGEVASLCHLARTICRRAERRAATLAREDVSCRPGLVYLNRLSDLFFVLSRVMARTHGEEETLWKPRRRPG